MRLTFTTGTTLALFVLATAGFAQSAAELLQKGIYTQETAGDPDGAIQIYRQVIAASPDQRATAAQAQFRIVQTLLQKGDLNGASLELGNLARNYSDYSRLVGSMASSSRGMPVSTPRLTAGTFQNGRYHHNLTGVEVSVPPGWLAMSDGGSSDGGEMVMFVKPGKQAEDVGVWMISEDTAPADIAVKLSSSVPRKAEMNRENRGFQFRTESIQPKIIGGHQALSAVANLGQDLVEYYTWIYTSKTHMVFLATRPRSELASLQATVDQMAATALVP